LPALLDDGTLAAMSPRQGRRNPFLPYAIAVASTAAAFALRWALQPVLGDRQPFVLFFAAIALTSSLGHWRAAVLALIAGLALADYFFIPPVGFFVEKSPSTLASLLLLGSVAVLVIVVIARAKTAIREREIAAAELRATFDNPSVGHGQGDPLTGKMLQVNDALCRMLGYSREEFVRLKMLDFVHPDDRHLTQEGVKQLLDGSRSRYEHDKRYLHKDGHTVWMHVTASLLRDADGQPERILGIFEDISTRKAAEQTAAKRELQLSLVLQAARFGVCEWNLAENSLVWSKEHFELLGYEPNSFQPTLEHFIKPIHPEDVPAVQAALERGRAKRETIAHEFRILLPTTGETRWLQAIGHFNYDKNGEATSLNGLLIDVTARHREAERSAADLARIKRAQDQLRERERELRLVTDAAPILLAHCDREKRFKFVNLPYAARFGRTVDDLIGQRIADVLGAEAFAVLEPYADRALRGEHVSYEAEVPYQQIGSRWMHCEYVPEITQAGVTGYIAVVMDITDRKQTELALQHAQSLVTEEAKHLEQLVDERTDQLRVSLMDMENLCYTIAHDLRAPLRAMQGFARALEEDYSAHLEPTGREYAHRITRAAARMDALITDLLAYGRIGTGEMTLHPVELDTVIDQFLADYAETIRDRNATVCVERLLPVVMANPGVLQQVIANLLLNATKFVASGVAPQVRVFAEDRGQFARLCVEDNGIGIAEEHRAKLFHVFQRLHAPDKYPGTGIGLAMVKKAVERMKGRTGFDSVPGRGSTFWIELEKPSNNAAAARRTTRSRTSG
jgi:PAS domain S-box-containing protein